MYCPSCGSDERQLSQYCRACGIDLRAVRMTLERPDAITQSAVSARDQIGRAVAEKIRTVESARDLHRVAEDVLPEIEKFLESPEEKRLRRLRSGTIVAFVGLGVMLGAIVASFVERGLFVLMIPGFVALFIGLGILANALMFTVPRKEIPDHSSEGLTQKNLDSVTKGRPSNLLVSDGSTNDLNSGERGPLSITEHTTHQLKTGR